MSMLNVSTVLVVILVIVRMDIEEVDRKTNVTVRNVSVHVLQLAIMRKSRNGSTLVSHTCYT
jgi:hypothetical protein